MDTESSTVSAPVPCSIQKGPFICGGCGAAMDSICILYAHMTETHSDGSFHYDNMIKTAFPKHDSCCVNTQTETKYMLYMRILRRNYKKKPPHRLDGQSIETEVRGNRIYLTSLEEHLQQEQPKEESPQLNISHEESQIRQKELQTKNHKLLKQSNVVGSNKLRRSTRITQSYLQNCVVKLDRIEVYNNDKNPTMTECLDAPAVVKVQVSPKEEQFQKPVSCAVVNDGHGIIKTELVATDEDGSYSQIDANDDDTDTGDNFQTPLDRNCTDKPNITEDSTRSNTPSNLPIVEENATSGHDDNGTCMNSSDEMNENESALSTTVVKKSSKRKRYKKWENERRPRGRPRGPGYGSKKERGPIGRPHANKFVCHICGQALKSSNETIESHMNEHMGLKPYICEICALPFHTEKKLARHQRRHEALVRTSQFRCDECDRHFPFKLEYLAHINKHSGSRPYKCDYCDRTFATTKYKRQHIYMVHTDRSLNCKICGKIYGKLSSFNNHMASAHIEPKFQCRFCDRRFSKKTVLQNHEWIHSATKQYTCCVCSHGFIQWTPYLSHMMKQHGFCRDKVVELKKTNDNENLPT